MIKELRVLNKVLTWDDRGLLWEPDPRHAELVARDLGLELGVSTGAATPGVKSDKRPDGRSEHL